MQLYLQKIIESLRGRLTRIEQGQADLSRDLKALEERVAVLEQPVKAKTR